MSKIVFTNGCFDILHRGHIEYLEESRKLGDYLIVGLNSDISVKTLKGNNRPINNEEDRAKILSALRCVNKVIIFDEIDPLKLIKEVKPDILVKGCDWKVENMIGHEFVLERGGEVYALDISGEYSTTNIIDKIKQI